MRSFVLGALTLAGLAGLFDPTSAQAQTPPFASDDYEALFSRLLLRPDDPVLNKEFARQAVTRGDLRLAFASLERVVVSSPGDAEAQAEFDLLRNKLMPAVTRVTVEVGASYVSNPRQLPSSASLVVNNHPNLVPANAPISIRRSADATFDARISVADERTVVGLRWRTLALAQGQTQAKDAALAAENSQLQITPFQSEFSALNASTLAAQSGPVFQLTPDLWMHVAGGAAMAWLDEHELYNDALVSVTLGGLYRGLTQTMTASYTWRDGNFDDFKANNAQIFDLEGKLALSPSLIKGDLLYVRPGLQVSQADGVRTGVLGPSFSPLLFVRPLFPGDFTQVGGTVDYYYPLFKGRAFVGAGLTIYQRWYDEGAGAEVNVDAKRRDTYVEPAAHLILPNLLGPNLDLRVDYRYEHNDFEREDSDEHVVYWRPCWRNSPYTRHRTARELRESCCRGAHRREVLMPRMSINALLAIPLLALPFAAQAETQVGTAAAVRNDVKGSITGQMSSGSPVHQSETVAASVDSSAQLLFRDKTSLTLGPSSQVKINKFVYDPHRGTGEAAVNLIKGALRFVGGSQSPENYSVRTPLASMGLRGSVAEMFVSNAGFEFFLLIEGSLEVCVARKCQSLTTPGQYILVSPDGGIAPPAPWPGPMLDLTASVAFLETYFSSLVKRDQDVLPRYRDLNDALKSRCFGEGCAQ